MSELMHEDIQLLAASGDDRFAKGEVHRALADVVMEIKRGSSKWIKTQGPSFGSFHWQNGYGAFSIGQSGVDETRKYIEAQAEHHRVKTFQEEFRAFLDRHGVEYDERYLWG